MLKAEEQMELTVLKKHGESIRSISRSTGRSRNTVRRYLRGGDTAARGKPGPKRAEKLDPYIDRVAAASPDVIPNGCDDQEQRHTGDIGANRDPRCGQRENDGRE